MKEILQTETSVEIKTERPSSPHETILKEKNRITDKYKLVGAYNVNEANFVKIKNDGEGVFKPGSKEKGGTSEIGSGYKRERAVYLVDIFLGFNLVPPTVICNINNEDGSLQKYIPNARTGRKFILSSKLARKVADKGDLLEIRTFLKNIGSNFILKGKKFEFLAKIGWRKASEFGQIANW